MNEPAQIAYDQHLLDDRLERPLADQRVEYIGDIVPVWKITWQKYIGHSQYTTSVHSFSN